MKMRSIVYVGFGTAVTIWACDMPTSYSCMEDHSCWPVGGAAGETSSGIGGVTSTTTLNGQGGVIGTETYAGGSGGALPCNGTCGGLTPICDAAKNKCVSCTANSNCTVAPLNVCDASSASCVECVVNTDCKSGDKHACKTDTKSCVECVVNGDCAAKVTVHGTAGAPGTAGASSTAGAPGLAGAAGAPFSDAVQNRSVCDTSSNICVGCLQNADCVGSPGTPLCNKDKKQCVACLSNGDCSSASASRCDLASNACAPCATNDDCTQIDGKHLCLSGNAGQANRCVECTVGNEAACNGNSCNPKTNACTATMKGSRKTCQSCFADSECGDGNGSVDPNKRCVPMTFKGEKHGEAGYCLQRASVGCSSPYKVNINATSLSGLAADDYCGINQLATTCEALLDLATSQSCADDLSCGDGTGGLCRNLAAASAPVDLRCTIPCTENTECTGIRTCSDTTNGYCK